MSFKDIPILDVRLAQDPNTKDQFFAQLRHALVEVGFLVITNFYTLGIDKENFDEIEQAAVDFFRLPDEIKLGCEMINSKHFLGYSRLANEITASHTDWREQIDLGTELPPPKEGDPLYKNIEGPNLWPKSEAIPNFRPAVEHYISKMTNVSNNFRRLVSELLGLDANALDKYFKINQQCKMKMVAYPDSHQLDSVEAKETEDAPGETQQGCGPHRDSDLLTYIHQVTEHRNSLQVQNFEGEWVTVPYIPNSLVINCGQTLEAITDGVCKATIHRVLIPESGSGTRISIPFFQTINLDTTKELINNIPAEVLALRDGRDEQAKAWGVDIGFQFIPDVATQPVGWAVFKNRIKSHQDVAARWYPEVLQKVLTEYAF
ncbi:uncharacterized protein KQ657_002769 [Scheffersomyces spartinae]|uniref:Fe2OG dioxygenase domain-containing protein n=1 Tax=Scheffersomyces spartinae TaxID=45513 RepID=A0A9P7V606_9ASCO|nr:uncharacterized protein KQ657_002769 [Scheffersomyces spartinae]KAG7191804.1 hypothetical protein KQ657_002769 [Scheffersomyces spartinae]